MIWLEIRILFRLPITFFYLSTNKTLPRVGSFYSYRLLSFWAGSEEPRRTSGNELSGARELDKSVRPRYQCRSRTEYRCESLSADQGPAFSPTRDVIIILYRPTQLWDRQDAGRTLTVMVIICSRTMESYRKNLRNLNSENALNIRSLWFIYVLF